MTLAICTQSACSAAAAESVNSRIIASVRQQLPKATITVVDSQQFILKVAGREGQNISVQRIDDFCKANPAEECTDQIKTFAISVVELATADFTVTPARVRVIVRNRLDTDGYLATILEQSKRPLTRPLFDGVSAVLAADFSKGTRMMSADDLRDLKLDADAAFALGIKQVLADLPPVPSVQEVDGKLITVSGFDYGASIMLLPERWRALAEATGGRLWIAIPGDNDVMIGTTKSAADLAKLRKLAAEEYRLAPRGISPEVYRWSPDGWIRAE